MAGATLSPRHLDGWRMIGWRRRVRPPSEEGDTMADDTGSETEGEAAHTTDEDAGAGGEAGWHAEAALGPDFSDVRVHEGGAAADLDAVAYTAGQDIYFPDAGEPPLAHELWHAIQQGQGLEEEAP